MTSDLSQKLNGKNYFEEKTIYFIKNYISESDSPPPLNQA
jgi:hypothetical protein